MAKHVNKIIAVIYQGEGDIFLAKTGMDGSLLFKKPEV
jgi:hypothetical protein